VTPTTTYDQAIVVLDDGSHLGNAHMAGGSMLYYKSKFDDEYETRMEYRTFFEDARCDRYGNLLNDNANKA